MKPETTSQRTTNILRTKSVNHYEDVASQMDKSGDSSENNKGAVQKVTHVNSKLNCDEPDSYVRTVDLANDLQEAFQQCQRIVKKIHTRKEDAKKKQKEEEDELEKLRKLIETLSEENRQLKQLNELEVSTNEQTEFSKEQKKEAIVAENIRLRMILKDVTEVNKRWQKYHHDRQEYVQHLLTTIREQEQKLSCQSQTPATENISLFSHRQTVSPSATRHSDSDLFDHSAEMAMLRQSYERSVMENSSIQKDLDEVRKNFTALAHQLDLTAKQNKEHVELLEMQVKTYKEDFEAERKEKDIAQKKIAELCQELSDLRNLVSSNQTCPNCSPAVSSPKNEITFLNMAPRMPKFQARGYVLVNAVADSTSPKEVESKPAATPEAISESWEPIENIDHAGEDDNAVQCPQCKMVFPTNRHYQFLDHFKECQKHSSF